MQHTHSIEKRRNLNRFFHRAGKWYIDVREGKKGPFHRREEAVDYLDRFKRLYGQDRR